MSRVRWVADTIKIPSMHETNSLFWVEQNCCCSAFPWEGNPSFTTCVMTKYFTKYKIQPTQFRERFQFRFQRTIIAVRGQEIYEIMHISECVQWKVVQRYTL